MKSTRIKYYTNVAVLEMSKSVDKWRERVHILKISEEMFSTPVLYDVIINKDEPMAKVQISSSELSESLVETQIHIHKS